MQMPNPRPQKREKIRCSSRWVWFKAENAVTVYSPKPSGTTFSLVKVGASLRNATERYSLPLNFAAPVCHHISKFSSSIHSTTISTVTTFSGISSLKTVTTAQAARGPHHDQSQTEISSGKLGGLF